MKAPEKIYVSIHSGIHHYEQKNDDDIEYIRKDAFIGKVSKWIIDNFPTVSRISALMYADDFKKAMEGE